MKVLKTQNKIYLIASAILFLLAIPLIIGFIVDVILEKGIESLKKELEQKQMEIYSVPYNKDTLNTIYKENAYKSYLKGIGALKSNPESVGEYIHRGVLSDYVAIFDTERLPGKYLFSSNAIIELATFSIQRAETLTPEKRLRVLTDVLIMARDVNNSTMTYDGCITGTIVSTYVLNEMKKIAPMLSIKDANNLKDNLKTIQNSWYLPESSMIQEAISQSLYGLEKKDNGLMSILHRYLVPGRFFSRHFTYLKEHRARMNFFKSYKSQDRFSESDYNAFSDYPEVRRLILDYFELRTHFAQLYTAIDVLNYYSVFYKLPDNTYFDTMLDKNLYMDPFTGKYADYYIDRDSLFVSMHNRGNINTIVYPVK